MMADDIGSAMDQCINRRNERANNKQQADTGDSEEEEESFDLEFA